MYTYLLISNIEPSRRITSLIYERSLNGGVHKGTIMVFRRLMNLALIRQRDGVGDGVGDGDGGDGLRRLSKSDGEQE